MSLLSGDQTIGFGGTNVQTAGRYEIVSKLGQGAAGIVYLALDPVIRRKVALKVSQAATTEFKDNFLYEAESAGRLNHPNIVAVYDAGAEKDHCYIAMEYIKGTTLESHCHKETLLAPGRGLEIVMDVCKGLDYAHKEGVIHRDIKPCNILLNEDGIAKITDFGVAQMTDKTFIGGIRGTPHYLSPEQIGGKMVSSQSDIFSLGCVLYEVLAGEKAFPGENAFGVMFNIVNSEPVPILDIRKELPKVIDEVIRRALQKSPEQRYQTCMEMADDLSVALRSIGKVAPKKEKVKEVVDYLHNLSFFSNFSIEQLHDLASMASFINVRAGRLVASEGEIDDTLYIILSGRAKVLRKGDVIATIDRGECFGEIALIGGKPRMANVQAETDCILMKITASLLQQLPEPIEFQFFKNFAKILVQRLTPP
ncbi:MAG: cyclic nucleotide-binding protein [Desulfobacteraceae bacterium]|nr:MAG: cyclic nucleotide-binding protein [Desulfobacteraceae bacterium]